MIVYKAVRRDPQGDLMLVIGGELDLFKERLVEEVDTLPSARSRGQLSLIRMTCDMDSYSVDDLMR